ncbi:MAG TPA: glycosyltransferase family 4 protein [Flavisolibacter sp.]|nr:glycosyltransferase family 4 protein [Flavisolibacter sp.]
MSRTIHIVCLDAPAPPDYGGAIDMYYKIQALAEAGNKIQLHYFDYQQGRSAAGLEKYCEEIVTYQRKSFLSSLFSQTPYIVHSRINEALVQRLNSDDHPILLEGLHCAGIVPFLRSPQRVVLRMHNEEAAYYRHLAGTETNVLKRFYFQRESKLLHRYQQRLRKDIKLACLSETDISVFQNNYQFQAAAFVPCFLPWQEVKSKTGKGSYCLYHGNMAVSENEEAAIWLIDHVFQELHIPLWIAGKGISRRLQEKAKHYPQVKLIHQPTIAEIDGLIAAAQINVLPSMNRTGVKLKLLNALFNGRFCITNTQGVEGSRIWNGVVVANEAIEWQQQIQTLFDKEFTETHLQERSELTKLYNNRRSAEKLSVQW